MQTDSKNSASIKQLKLPASIRLDGKPLYHFKGWTKKDMDALLLSANTDYEKRDYKKAYSCFAWLIFHDSQNKRAWFGAATCLEAMKEYQLAIGYYGTIALMDDHDPVPFFRLAHCHLQENNKEKAKQYLEKTIQAASREEERYAALKEQATQIKNTLFQ